MIATETFTDTALGVACSIALLAAVFIPLERLFTARRQRLLRKEWGTDLLFFLGQYLLWPGLIAAALLGLAELCELLPLAAVRDPVRALPFWSQVLLVLFLADVLVYWGHRLSHRVEFLWRFHRVHHTSERLDWLAAHREHPVDGLYTHVCVNLPAILLGFPIAAIFGVAVFRGMWAIFIHSNVQIPLGPLGMVLGSPRLHHWHHDLRSGHECNFANVSPLMDVMFGTYRNPDREPEAYGIPDELPHGYFHQMVEPFRRRRASTDTAAQR